MPAKDAESITEVKHYKGIALNSLFCESFNT